MLRTAWVSAVWLCLVCSVGAQAQPAVEQILPLDGHFNADGTAIELNWFDATPPRVGSVTVKRRRYGQVGGETWTPIASGLGPVVRYTDTTVVPGIAYEYQVLRFARDIVDVGYWLAGTRVPAHARRGTAYVIVDETVAPDIALRMDRFEGDLISDGWRVLRHQVPRDGGTAMERLETSAALRAWLQARYREDQFGAHAAILVGRVPFVKSGRMNPDGHDPVPHATDLFYAELDARWRATRDGEVVDTRVPGDFIEMQIGRIDFSTVSADRNSEIHLLRAYFDKNHHWRRGYLGDLREAYGQTRHLLAERAALRNVVGARNLTEGGHHDVGEERPWLWGVDFGDWNGGNYFTQHANRAVFTINFGSHKQKIGTAGNGMAAMLAQPWYTVSVGWGARPTWWLHHMALGGSIGLAHLRTVNNGRADRPYRTSMDYFPTGEFLWRNPIWVNLLGDPTLRAFPLSPVTGLRATAQAEGVELSWQPGPDGDALSYSLFQLVPGTGALKALTGGERVTDTAFLVTGAEAEQGHYMVRAYGLKEVYAGSFFTYAHGVTAPPVTSDGAAFASDIDIGTAPGQPVVLPGLFSQPQDGRVYAVIEGPPHGTLRFDGSNWVYTPRAGFTGSVVVRISVSDTWRSEEAVLRITVGG